MPAISSLYERKILQLFLVLAGLSLIVLSIFGDKGFLALEALQSQEAQLTAQVEELKLEQQEWQHKLKAVALQENYFDTLAREELGMVKANEKLILLSK